MLLSLAFVPLAVSSSPFDFAGSHQFGPAGKLYKFRYLAREKPEIVSSNPSGPIAFSFLFCSVWFLPEDVHTSTPIRAMAGWLLPFRTCSPAPLCAPEGSWRWGRQEMWSGC
mmetsp:Transcript_19432/g.38465  ORF Transcript_19432/g.38465 Transcript_19432/m.38465 type:complete len:112 (+) Transcript_19432:61-396(+)